MLKHATGINELDSEIQKLLNHGDTKIKTAFERRFDKKAYTFERKESVRKPRENENLKVTSNPENNRPDELDKV